MTVIAYRDGMMAADSCWSDNHENDSCSGLIFSHAPKLRRLSSGALYGGAGASDDRELVALLDNVTADSFANKAVAPLP